MSQSQHFQHSQQPIDQYIGELATRLEMPAAERGVTLQEIRAHLEELAANSMANGMDELAAQRLAIESFGDVRKVSRRLSEGEAIRWGARRWARGIGLGALLSWAIWTIGTFPVLEYDFTVNPVQTVGSPTPPFADPLQMLIQATPLASGGFYAYEMFDRFGWAWLLPLLLLYMLAPFLWGRRASRWWAPGLAYGLGTWLAMPWGLLYWFLWNHGDWAFQAEAALILMALPVALLASLAGCAWRQWMEARLVLRAQAAA